MTYLSLGAGLLVTSDLFVRAHLPALNRIAHWNLHNKERVRLALGLGVVVMGLAILAAV